MENKDIKIQVKQKQNEKLKIYQKIIIHAGKYIWIQKKTKIELLVETLFEGKKNKNKTKNI